MDREIDFPEHDVDGFIDEDCSVCGCSLTIDDWRDYLREGFPVCDICAEYIANFYNYARSGSYLTWPNVDPKPRYEKKPIPEELRWSVFQRDGFTCQHCGSNSCLRADHIIPESRGGETTYENLQTLCVSCNSRKGKKVPKTDEDAAWQE